MDALYYKTYEQSKSKDNDFNVIEMRWYEDPRYATDLEWHKEGAEPIKMYIQYDKEGNPIPVDTDKCDELIKQKYKPTSHWYRTMCRGMNNDARMIAQELDVSFLGSGGNVIHDEYIQFQEEQNVEEPKMISGNDNEFWIWQEPIEGHQYIMGADVSRGDGQDSSTIVIVDTTTMEQVMEYKGKTPPDLFANIIYEYAVHYDAYVVVDVIGLGVATVLKLLELECPNLHYDTPSNKVLSTTSKLEDYKKDNKIPGFTMGSGPIRTTLIQHLEMMIRTNGIKVKSRRLTGEMKTFIYKNGKPDHMTGYHDDLLMALGMALWIFQSAFKDLEKSKAKTKAMLDSWTINTPNQTPEQKKIEKNRPKFSPQVGRNMQDPRGEFQWLFR
jgi:hypothetical protein